MAGEYGRRRKALSRAGRSPQPEPGAESGRRRSTSDQALRRHSSIWRSSLTTLAHKTSPPALGTSLASNSCTRRRQQSRVLRVAFRENDGAQARLPTHARRPPSDVD
jgi:hypothetical protein